LKFFSIFSVFLPLFKRDPPRFPKILFYVGKIRKFWYIQTKEAGKQQKLFYGEVDKNFLTVSLKYAIL
jgi:hypothetical protein